MQVAPGEAIPNKSGMTLDHVKSVAERCHSTAGVILTGCPNSSSSSSSYALALGGHADDGSAIHARGHKNFMQPTRC